MIFTVCPAKTVYNIEKKIQTDRPEDKGRVALTPISSFDTHLAEGSKDLHSNKLDFKKKENNKTQN